MTPLDIPTTLLVLAMLIVAIAWYLDVRRMQREALFERAMEAEERRRESAQIAERLWAIEAARQAPSPATKTGRALLRLQHRAQAPGQVEPAPRVSITFATSDQLQ